LLEIPELLQNPRSAASSTVENFFGSSIARCVYDNSEVRVHADSQLLVFAESHRYLNPLRPELQPTVLLRHRLGA